MARPTVIDADGHITETTEQLAAYIDPEYRDYGAWKGHRAYYPSDAWDRSLRWSRGETAISAQDWLDAMGRGGMERVVLYPTTGLGIGWLREPELATAVCRAYNDLLHQEFLQADPRLQAVALLPMQDVPQAVAELRRAVGDKGLAGAFLPAVGLRKPLGHQDLWPVCEEAERLGTFVAVHATVRGPHYFGADLFDRFIEVHTLSHPFAQMTQMTSLVLQGVPERFPNLRIGFMEAGCAWVPYWLWRLDEEWEKRGKVEAPQCLQRPSEYVLSGRIFFPAEATENLLGEAVSFLGEDIIFYASDWPHWDHEYPQGIEEMLGRGDLSEQAKEKILGQTARRMYGLD